MPVPYLPLELVDLIISHVARSLPQGKRLEECGRLALVCKRWTRLAQTAGWQGTCVDVTGEMRLLDHLLEHPHLASCIRHLKTTVPWTGLEDANAEQRLLALLRQLKLRAIDLLINAETGPLFIRALGSLDTNQLRRLRCFGELDSLSTFESFADGLRSVTMLDDLIVVLRSEDQEQITASMPEHAARTIVKGLVFKAHGGDSARISTLFCALCDLLADGVEMCFLDLQDASFVSLAPLIRFSTLRRMHLDVRSATSAVLLRLCEEVGTLSHLSSLSIEHGAETGGIASGSATSATAVDSAELISRMSLNLHICFVTGWTIHIQLPKVVALLRPDTPLTDTHLILFRATVGSPPFATYVKVKHDGKPCWALIDTTFDASKQVAVVV